MKEKLQEYALIAEIVSAAAVVAGLIFVGLEVRQGAEETAANTQAIVISNVQALAERTQQMTLQLASNEVYAQAFINAQKNDISSLTPLERVHVTGFIVTMLKVGEESFIQYQSGYLSEELLNTRLALVVNTIQGGGVSMQMFNSMKEGENFIAEYMDELVSRVGF